MMARALLLITLALCISQSTATRTGDESFGAAANGTFYVFADKTIHVISPNNGSVVRNITLDQSGAPLTSNGSLTGSSNTSRGWNDAAYIRGSVAGTQFVAVNEADTYSSGNSTIGYVTVLDAVAQKVISRVTVGGRPVHIYSINQTSSIWSHSDAEGTFYVIPMNSTSNVSVSTTVKAFSNNPAHGKLLINNALYPIGYGTNVAESIIPKFNLSSATKIGSFPFNQSLPNATLCVGTHTVVYSRVNRHAYFECIGGGGILEWNTANDSFVAIHPIIGVVTGSPADDIIFVGSNTGSQATIIVPGANGQPSTAPAVLSVPYNPAYPQFWSNSTDTTSEANFSAWTVYFPLTRNTNINNINAAGSANVTTLSYMVRPTDCQYAGNVSASSIDDADDDEAASSTPGLSLLTQGGSAVTPRCGACALGINTTDPSQFNTSLSGLGMYSMNGWSSGAKNASTTLVSAGATLPTANLASGANQCAFSTSSYRALKRGGSFLATIAQLPQNSLYLVNAANSNSVSYVNTATNPKTLAWVPAS